MIASLLASVVPAAAQSEIIGGVRDETGGALPGVVVELVEASASRQTATDAQGAYRFDAAAPGRAQLSFALINFAIARRNVTIPVAGTLRVDTTLHLSLGADVTVTAKSTFTNLADAEDPARNLVGIAQSASQGAITARQLDARSWANRSFVWAGAARVICVRSRRPRRRLERAACWPQSRSSTTTDRGRYPMIARR